VCLVAWNEMGRKWECFLLVFMCAEFRATVLGSWAFSQVHLPATILCIIIMKAVVARGHQVTVISTDCLKVRVQGIFTHSVACLDTQCLRSNCAVSRRLRKLNSAQVGDQYCMVNSVCIETLLYLGMSYVPEDPVEVGVDSCELYDPVEIQTQHTRSW